MLTVKNAAVRGAKALAFMTMLAGTASVASAALTVTPGWSNYRWSRTGNLELAVGLNVTSNWLPFVQQATSAWSADPRIDMVTVAGRTTASTCGSVYGTIQVCNSNYGANGWLGYATLFTSGRYIVSATVKLNDYYFKTATYNNNAFRSQVACQEIGHTLGLGHLDTNNTNANQGTCMDYSRDPGATTGKYGTLTNLAPGQQDWAALNKIYATTDATQLPFTTPGFWVGHAYSVDDGHDHDHGADDYDSGVVPEPSSWAMMITGFGLVGAAARRRRTARVAA